RRSTGIAGAKLSGGRGTSAIRRSADVSHARSCHRRSAPRDGHSGETLHDSGQTGCTCAAAWRAYELRSGGVVGDGFVFHRSARCAGRDSLAGAAGLVIMLAVLGFATIAALLAVILGRRMSPLSALIAVPVAAALVGGFGARTAGFMVKGIQGVAGVAG